MRLRAFSTGAAQAVLDHRIAFLLSVFVFDLGLCHAQAPNELEAHTGINPRAQLP